MLGCYNGFFIAESVTVLSCVLLQFYFTLNKALITLFEGGAAAMRPAGTMNVQKVYWWKHNCKTGQYPQIKVFKTLDIQPQKEYPFFTVTETPLPDLTPEVYTL